MASKKKVRTLSKEQAKVLRISGALHKKYAKDFEGWVEDNISFSGLKLDGITDQQREIAENLAEHKKCMCECWWRYRKNGSCCVNGPLVFIFLSIL